MKSSPPTWKSSLLPREILFPSRGNPRVGALELGPLCKSVESIRVPAKLTSSTNPPKLGVLQKGNGTSLLMSRIYELMISYIYFTFGYKCWWQGLRMQLNFHSKTRLVLYSRQRLLQGRSEILSLGLTKMHECFSGEEHIFHSKIVRFENISIISQYLLRFFNFYIFATCLLAYQSRPAGTRLAAQNVCLETPPPQQSNPINNNSQRKITCIL